MKRLLFLSIIISFRVLSSEEKMELVEFKDSKGVSVAWIKYHGISRVKYFPLKKRLPLCGTYIDVIGNLKTIKTPEGSPSSTLEIESCLNAKDSLDDKDIKNKFLIHGFEGNNLLISEHDSEVLYKFPIQDLSTYWAWRFSNADLMLEEIAPFSCLIQNNSIVCRSDNSLCGVMSSWWSRKPQSIIPADYKGQIPSPLPETNLEGGTLIRNHVFEYHLGCGT